MDLKAIDELLASLNEHQRRAAEVGPGAMVVSGCPGCIDGDSAMIQYQRGRRRGSRPLTLRELYMKFNGSPGATQPWAKKEISTQTYSITADGVVYYNDILAVVYSGKRNCVRVSCDDGSSLICTPEHPFALPGIQYAPAAELRRGSRGSEVLRVGSMLPQRGAGKQKSAPRVIIDTKHHPYGNTHRVRAVERMRNPTTYTYHRVRRARLVVEAALNGMAYDAFVVVLKNDSARAASFAYLPPHLEIHHKDGDSLNDTLSNLVVLSKEAHSRLHGKNENFNVEYTRRVRVVRVEYVGERDTFDIQMRGPDYNFAANGFLVHNSGKTRTLVARIARMARDGLDPKYVLAMTFTRNAAQEMNERLGVLGVLGGQVGTIHSLSLQILRESAPMLIAALRLDESGFKLDTELRRALGDLRRDRLIDRGAAPDVDNIKRFIGVFKSSGICPIHGNPFGTNDEGAKRLHDEAPLYRHETGLMGGALERLYMQLEQRRVAAGLYDFDDMQLFAWLLLLVSPEVREHWRNRYSVVMIDESQDSSAVQWDLARILGRGASRILPERTPNDPAVPPLLSVYGQVAQSVYSWRAAVPEWMTSFAQTEGVALLTLPVNYRSGPEICCIADHLVRGKAWHLDGPMETASTEPATTESYEHVFTLRMYQSLQHEVNGVLDWMTKQCDGVWCRGVVLARLAMVLHLIEIECIRRKIPYEKRASGAFFDAKEVQDLLSYLRVAGGWDTPDHAWMKRCIRVPFRYIGKNALDWTTGECRRLPGSNFLQTLMEAPQLSGRQVRALTELEEVLTSLTGLIEHGCTPAVCIKHVIEETHYWDWMREEGGAQRIDASKVAVIDHVLKLGDAVESVSDFVAQVDNLAAGVTVGRKAAQKKEGDRLILSTVHRFKGLEADYVGIVDMAEGRFPWNRGHSADEELRLLFVAVTRARKAVHVSCAGVPSAHYHRLEDELEAATAALVPTPPAPSPRRKKAPDADTRG